MVSATSELNRFGTFGQVAFAALAAACLTCRASAENDPVRVILFGSMDAGPSTFVATGAKIGLDDVNRDGFAALVSLGGGVRSERAATGPNWTVPTLVRATLVGSALGGYQSFYDWGVVGLFAGPEASHEAVFGGGGSRALPIRLGLRLQGEIWARPTDASLATGTLVIGSAREEVYARVSGGYRFLGIYWGPEAVFYADRTGYRKANLGLHATNIQFGAFSLRVSTGWQYEIKTHRSAPYFALAGWTPL